MKISSILFKFHTLLMIERKNPILFNSTPKPICFKITQVWEYLSKYSKNMLLEC